jgi:hypothetical protein
MVSFHMLDTRQYRGDQPCGVQPLFAGPAECWWARTGLESMLKLHSTPRNEVRRRHIDLG